MTVGEKAGIRLAFTVVMFLGVVIAAEFDHWLQIPFFAAEVAGFFWLLSLWGEA